MKKSIYLFIGGSLFGVIAAFAIIKSTTNTEQTAAIPTTNTGIKVVTAKMQADNMPTESLSDMQVRLSQLSGAQDTMDESNNEQSSMSTNEESPVSATQSPPTQPNQKMMSSEHGTLPTEKQVQQYSAMEETIASAVNNPKIKLSDLLRQSDTLTIQQRNQLTQKTIDMINRGELKIDQFANK